MSYPDERPRRLRKGERLRAMVRETTLTPASLIYPLFVTPGNGIRREIPSLPDCYHLSVDQVAREAEVVEKLGIGGVILFGLPSAKDPVGSEGYADDGVVQQAIGAIRGVCKELLVVTDVCLCEYTSHGHCGVVEHGEVQNDPSLELLAKMAVSHAKAGAHVVAPSDMMDGRVGAIRDALDAAGFAGLPILSYAAKYASAFYGPFREAADSTPAFGDRRGYQMDPANVREALRECTLDVEEGADALLVKPALPNLDVLRAVRERFELPVGAYNVSGEYAMLRAAGARGWLDERQAALESLTAIFRAGADLVVSYWTKELAGWL